MAELGKESYFADVASQVNVDELELGVLDFWEKEQIFAKSLEQTKDGRLFTFYDGPPYATGKPHYGHVLQSAIKDTVLRYKTMQGYYVPRRVGWDCHGLPVENLVERELGIKTKKEIEDDIEGFNKKCREVVFRYIDDFTKTLKRIGRWADYSKGYATLDKDYMETEWWVFRQLWEQQLVYKDFRSTPYCIHCQTPLSNFEVSMAYQDKVDTAVYVLLAVVGQENLSLLVWTTTPWTLPANVAVAVGKDMEYVTVVVDGKSLVVAKERALKLFGQDVEMTKTWKLDELRALKYKPLYESNLSPAQIQASFKIVEGPHVTAKDGTGLVHMAPAFGEEDFAIAKTEGLPILRTVGVDGRYLPEVPVWAGKGIFAANKEIVADLKTRGLLFKDEQYKHSYPHCWRCDTPLIYYALDSWFLKVTDLKEQMLKNNEEISWVPEHLKHGRFAKGIESAPDWAISRNRFWSVPLPVWVCDSCGEQLCVGSVADLKAASGASDEALADMHRPYVDRITWGCKACGKGEMHRTPEVLDVWFDSGSMPYAQWHYPFANKEFVEKGFPADFIAESMEMTRAWFYVSHVLATALTKKDIGLGVNKPAFKNVIGSGLIFAANGQKLSKKLKNYPDIEPTMQAYGADVLRMYLLTSASLGEPYRFNEKDLQQLKRNTYLTLWNVYSFFVSYANVHAWQPSQAGKRSQHILDKWILARTDELLAQVRLHADAYHIDTAARLFIPFIDDLSNWYVRRSRARFQKPVDTDEKNEAFGTLHEVLVRTATLLAPFMPFVAEHMFRNLTGEASVHLARLPAEGQVDWHEGEHHKDVLSVMNIVRDTVAEGLALRAKAKLKVRQPLATLYVQSEPLAPELTQIIAEEVNVKKVEFGRAPEGSQVVTNEAGTVALETALTPELEAEGMGREVIRHGQMLRREAGYALDDSIRLILLTEDKGLQAILQSQSDIFMTALQAVDILDSGEEDKGQDVSLGGASLHIGVKKV